MESFPGGPNVYDEFYFLETGSFSLGVTNTLGTAKVLGSNLVRACFLREISFFK